MVGHVYLDERGYKRVIEVKEGTLIHRAIAYKEIYQKNREKYPKRFRFYVVHHVNGNKEDNSLNNLMLLTREEHNRIHGRRTGKKKITEKDVEFPLELVSGIVGVLLFGFSLYLYDTFNFPFKFLEWTILLIIAIFFAIPYTIKNYNNPKSLFYRFFH